LGTLLVNCLGGLLIGAAMVWFARYPNETLRLLLITGFLGGMTTFSAFTGESLAMLQRGDWGWALAHTMTHVLGALGCAALGFRLAHMIWGADAG
jgi:CrcB protein